MPLPFTPPMECLAVKQLPEGDAWSYELKLDGYRAQAIHDAGEVRLLSRNGKAMTAQAPLVGAALQRLLPAETVLDGELCALDAAGRPSFQLMQNRKSNKARLVFFAFDVLYLRGKPLLASPLVERRAALERLLGNADPAGDVQLSASLRVPLAHMLNTVRTMRLEGVVAKWLPSRYEPGLRSGLWVKHRLISAQEFVIGGYTPGTHGIDALLLGFYREGKLLFCSSVRNGFVPASRRTTFAKLQLFRTDVMPFANLPDKQPGRWGHGLTAEKMRECVWLRPQLVAQCEFLEWTDGDRLRHASFVALRADKEARGVVKEEPQ